MKQDLGIRTENNQNIGGPLEAKLAIPFLMKGKTHVALIDSGAQRKFSDPNLVKYLPVVSHAPIIVLAALGYSSKAKDILQISCTINDRKFCDPFIKLKHPKKDIILGTPFCNQYGTLIDLTILEFQSPAISSNDFVKEALGEEPELGLIIISELHTPAAETP